MNKVPVEGTVKLQEKSINVIFSQSGNSALIKYIRYRGRSPKRLLTLLHNYDTYKYLQTDIIFDSKKIFGDFRKRFLHKLIVNKNTDTERLSIALPRLKDKSGHGLLHYCVAYGFTDLVNKKLLNYTTIDINSTDIFLRTPLMFAVTRQEVEIAQLLLDYKANPVKKKKVEIILE